jgi:hypothetical protein
MASMPLAHHWRPAGLVGALTLALAGCGHPAAPALVPPAAHAPYTASQACRPSPPDVVAFSAIPSSAGTGTSFQKFPPAALIPLNPFMDAHASVYGGTFFRADHGYVGFVADAPTHLAELRALTPDPDFFIAYCAPFSIAQQRTVSDAVPHDAVLQAHGVEVIGSGLDEAHGRVEVQVTKITKETVSLLHQRYGDIIGQVDQQEGGTQGIAGGPLLK